MSARCTYEQAIGRLAILARLAPFDPHVAGTPPLGIDRPDSDIDILCTAADPEVFAEAVWAAFSAFDGFAIRQWTGEDRPVIATFDAEGWTFELFCSPEPVARQWGWRHFLIERRLLDLGGPPFRAAVMAERARGAKTEPAFAAVLGLSGDRYRALLELEEASDAEVMAMIAGR